MIVGIDLGTTNSLIAYFDGDHAKVIPNRLGENLTPSVVSVDEEGIVYVGKTAKERKMLYPDPRMCSSGTWAARRCLPLEPASSLRKSFPALF